MAEEPSQEPVRNIDARCAVCGRTRWYVRGEWICKNCHWREEEAKVKAKETET